MGQRWLDGKDISLLVCIHTSQKHHFSLAFSKFRQHNGKGKTRSTGGYRDGVRGWYQRIQEEVEVVLEYDIHITASWFISWILCLNQLLKKKQKNRKKNRFWGKGRDMSSFIRKKTTFLCSFPHLGFAFQTERTKTANGLTSEGNRAAKNGSKTVSVVSMSTEKEGIFLRNARSCECGIRPEFENWLVVSTLFLLPFS